MQQGAPSKVGIECVHNRLHFLLMSNDSENRFHFLKAQKSLRHVDFVWPCFKLDLYLNSDLCHRLCTR